MNSKTDYFVQKIEKFRIKRAPEGRARVRSEFSRSVILIGVNPIFQELLSKVETREENEVRGANMLEKDQTSK